MPALNVYPGEADKFGRLGSQWWDPNGPMRSLHLIDPLRMRFVEQCCELQGRRVLDVGCGGGLLTESLARAGASTMGIDLSEDLLEVAGRHADMSSLPVEYRLVSVEQLAAEQPEQFDVVTCMETLEHIPDRPSVVAAISGLLRAGGNAFFATIDRSLASLFAVILVGEYMLHLLPRGSHDFRHLVRPNELIRWAQAADLVPARWAGIRYSPLFATFSLIPQRDMNYMGHFIRK